jgi:hypothetical protein
MAPVSSLDPCRVVGSTAREGTKTSAADSSTADGPSRDQYVSTTTIPFRFGRWRLRRPWEIYRLGVFPARAPQSAWFMSVLPALGWLAGSPAVGLLAVPAGRWVLPVTAAGTA